MEQHAAEQAVKELSYSVPVDHYLNETLRLVPKERAGVCDRPSAALTGPRNGGTDGTGEGTVRLT